MTQKLIAASGAIKITPPCKELIADLEGAKSPPEMMTASGLYQRYRATSGPKLMQAIAKSGGGVFDIIADQEQERRDAAHTSAEVVE